MGVAPFLAMVLLGDRRLPMVRVVVTGLGLRCGLGDLSTAWRRLLAGETAIQLRQPFRDLSVFPVAMLGQHPAQLPDLIGQLVTDVLQDAQCVTPLRDCAVVVGSSRGFQGQWEVWQRQSRQGNGAGLGAWLDYLPNGIAVAIARQLGATAAVLAPMGACSTGLWAIGQGYDLLQRGEAQRAIVGAVESPITRLSLAGFQQMGALAKTGCFPFDQRREGLVLGEGGALLVLETLAAATERGARIYGEILGWSFTCDAHHVSAPPHHHQAASRAIAQCLRRSGLEPRQIDHIHPHGTSTTLNDRAEATLIQRLFPHQPLVSGSKGATGHTLGASGAISVVFSLMMLQQQQLFPTVGLTQPEFDLNFVRRSHSQALNYALCLSFGFGGQNGALAIAKW